ncbi:MAG: sigma 54 modulation/S30EA ribosomal C-terminal domain-containing protein [Acidimicrobiia bacterium]
MVTTNEQVVEVVVQTHGDVNGWEREYARDKVDRLRSLAGAPVLFARVDLRWSTDPARERPVDAKASIDVNGRLVRAHVAADTVTEAVDLLDARLRERLARLSGRAETRVHTAPRPSVREVRPAFAARPADEREVVAHKSFAVGEQTVDEAVGDLELLDHDFFLFRNAATGEDNVVARADDGYELFEPRIRCPLADVVEPVHHSPVSPPVVPLDEAIEILDLGDLPFVFFVDPDDGRGRVCYRRYDGHYGMIVPGDG